MEISELNNLKDQIPQLGKNKLHEVWKLSDAWKILDKLYSDQKEIWSKLKSLIRNIKLKASKSLEWEIELFNTIQYISSRIKAIGGQNMLAADHEYILLINGHLDSNLINK